MKRFSNLKTVLFDSTSASFRMTVEGVFIKKNPTGNYSDLVYVSNQGNGSLNPNIYVTFSNKAEGAKALYTSYPQIPKFRKAMGKIADILDSEAGFVDVDGMLTVDPKYAQPVSITNIGKQSRWVSFKLVTVESGDNGVVTAVPGVAITISDENESSYTSVLTDDEFMTVYHIVKDINLPQIQISMSLAFLAADDGGQQMMRQAPAPQYGNFAQPQQQYYNNYNNGPQNNYQNGGYNGGYSRPQNNGGYQNQPRYNNNVAPRAVANSAQPVVSQPVQTPNAGQQMTPRQPVNLPPRTEKTIVNMRAVEETPVSDINFDNLDSIDDILNGDM